MTKQKWKKKKTLLSCASSASCLGIIRKAGARLEEREKCREEGERTRQKKKKEDTETLTRMSLLQEMSTSFFFFFQSDMVVDESQVFSDTRHEGRNGKRSI